MICLRCGHCCINYDVIIIKDAAKGIKEGNFKHKKSKEKCPHLLGTKPGNFSCAIHEKKWYKDTPCYAHTQIERKNSPCRIGTYLLEKKAESALLR